MTDLRDPDAALLPAATAIADGVPVDWTAVESTPEDEAERALVRDLRIVAEIVALHRELAPDAGTTVVDELRQSSAQSSSPDDVSAPASPTADFPTWGHLQLTQLVGGGAFGEVYRARDPRLDRDVALKLLRRLESERPRGSAVVEEGRLLARVRHPNVITVYGADRIQGHVGVWMEFIRGRTLEQDLAARGRFDPAEVTQIGIDVCRALEAVHRAGLLHRDVKAQNVMRDADGRIVLMDFGAGREEQLLGATSDLAGTPLYLAPEIFAGGAASPQSDLYSVGVLLYRLLTGAYPVTGRTLPEVRKAHTQGGRVSLAEARPDLPAQLVTIVERALARDPAERYDSASDMEAALVGLIQPKPTAAAPRVVSPRWKLAAMGIAVLALMVTAWMSRGVLLRLTTPSATATFQARDWLLITDIENLTGEELFDGGIEYALEHDIVASRHVRVVSRERVEDALRLMAKPVSAVLNRELGRDVALRDGGVAAVLAGQLEKRGGTYVLRLQVLNPTSGTTWATATEDAPTQADVLGAIHRQADWVRRALGDPVRSVSTPTMRARAPRRHLSAHSSSIPMRPRNSCATAGMRRSSKRAPRSPKIRPSPRPLFCWRGR